ncbi:hypothetical protein GCM10023116_36310 [Kistimonas scapharcae]|uniref:Uncharacterized protein n=1 Tax=Kistimonas scapharcae TaxID=1036133 RepID=A0ABP8V8Q2_9GAMM
MKDSKGVARAAAIMDITRLRMAMPLGMMTELTRLRPKHTLTAVNLLQHLKVRALREMIVALAVVAATVVPQIVVAKAVRGQAPAAVRA